MAELRITSDELKNIADELRIKAETLRLQINDIKNLLDTIDDVWNDENICDAVDQGKGMIEYCTKLSIILESLSKNFSQAYLMFDKAENLWADNIANTFL